MHTIMCGKQYSTFCGEVGEEEECDMAPLPLCDDLPTSSLPLLFRLKNALLFLPLQKKRGPGLSSEECQKKKGEEEGKKVSNPPSLFSQVISSKTSAQKVKTFKFLHNVLRTC